MLPSDTVSHTDPIHYTEALVAVYPNLDAAEAAVRHLTDHDVAPAEISLIGVSAQDRADAETGQLELPDGILRAQNHRDVAIGAGVGGALGLLLGLEVAMLTGIGTILVLGPLAAGALYTGFLTALIQVGANHQRDSNAQYRAFIHGGNILLVVHLRNREERDRVAIDETAPLWTEVFPYHVRLPTR